MYVFSLSPYCNQVVPKEVSAIYHEKKPPWLLVTSSPLICIFKWYESVFNETNPEANDNNKKNEMKRSVITKLTSEIKKRYAHQLHRKMPLRC